jgi:Putative metallopeptidase
MRLCRNIAFGVSVLLVMFGGASCFGNDDSTPARAKGKGRVTTVYQDDTIRPENRDAMKKIMDSGVFERMADCLTKAVALPHDLQVVVTDNVPKGIDDPTTELDGRRIFWPAAFSKETHDVLTEFLPEVVRDKGAPKVISQENFTADVLNVWGNQFILGHELGHAVIHQLNLPLTGLEEDFADGFATFFTVNDKDTGPNAALGAAVLFDAMGRKRPNLTMEDFSSDHAVILRGLQLPLLRPWERSPAVTLSRHRRLHPRVSRHALRQGMDAAQQRLVDSARAAPHPQLQEGDGSRPPTGSPEHRRRDQGAVRQAQADARSAVSTLAGRR